MIISSNCHIISFNGYPMASVKRKKLAESVIEEIKRMIVDGELKEGDKLPNQNEFAVQLGVSRPSLREALHTLALIGAIEQRPGLGTVLKQLDPKLWADQLSPPLVSDEQSTLELLEARRFLEVSATELAVQKATKNEIQRMAKLIQNMNQAIKKNETRGYASLDMEFHHQIVRSSHNRFLVHLFVIIRGLMERFIHESVIFKLRPIERSLEFHTHIYEGIKERDTQKAVINIKEHIQDVEQTLRRHYNSLKHER